MNYSRAAGILLHPTSLPDSAGIGTFGKAAYAFVDFLKKSRHALWQVLPLGPTGYGDSPYQSFSTFALNPLLIDIPLLVERQWAAPESQAVPDGIRTGGDIDYGAVVSWKMPLLKSCAAWFFAHAAEEDKAAFAQFCEENSPWLDDFALFMSLKTAHGGQCFQQWEKSLAMHDAGALEQWKASHAEDVAVYKAIQFFAYTQWLDLKRYANENGVSIIGDIPIFVAPDSADVWSQQQFFQLDKNGVPKVVAGVPPDYFSPTGQLWGNPLYDWAAMKKDGYRWWIRRIKQMLVIADYVRIDHFRGFEAYWAVPYGSENAVSGMWKKGPGKALFTAIRDALGELPLIAEDLGLITDGVRKLRDGCGLPGMKILQFAFDSAEFAAGNLVNAFLPHTYTENCVVYTGTHDNDTTQGWLESLSDKELSLVASYVSGEDCSIVQAQALRHDGELCCKLLQCAYASVARFAIAPMQDVYALGSFARMNTPATGAGNWSWRMESDMLSGARAEEAAKACAVRAILYGRAE